MNAKVSDCFEIKPGMAGSDHAPGAIVVFDASAFEFDQLPIVGVRITIQPLTGQSLMAVVGERKHHGDAMSLFFADLTSEAVPIGSTIEWSPSPLKVPLIAKG